jgi:penicillin V acylase-like amidase (Ntn superfamily)
MEGMMKVLLKRVIGLAALLALGAGFLPGEARSCTAVVLQRGSRVILAKNFDWFTGKGFVVLNRKGIKKRGIMQSGVTDNLHSWVSRYGSITVTWVGVGFPSGGMNQAGLSVTSLLFEPSQYPELDERPVLSPSQWKQYVLDTCSSVDQAIKSLENIRLHTTSIYGQQFVIADKNGDAALVQFIQGKPRIYRGKDLPHPVTINDLPYPLGLAELKKGSGPARFTTAAQECQVIQGGDMELCKAAFGLLDKVSLGDYTRWQLVHDLGEQELRIKSSQQDKAWLIKLNHLDFSCTGPVRFFDINQPVPQDAGPRFVDFTQAAYDNYMKGLTKRLRTSREAFELIRTYPAGLSCAPLVGGQ